MGLVGRLLVAGGSALIGLALGRAAREAAREAAYVTAAGGGADPRRSEPDSLYEWLRERTETPELRETIFGPDADRA